MPPPNLLIMYRPILILTLSIIILLIYEYIIDFFQQNYELYLYYCMKKAEHDIIWQGHILDRHDLITKI